MLSKRLERTRRSFSWKALHREKCVEIRSYNLKPGIRSEFHRLVIENALPMMKRWKVDVVAYGPSPHDGDSYYLIRSYASLKDRQSSQDAYYGSEEWRSGHRDAILALIDTHASIVLELEEATVNALRKSSH